MYPHYCDKPTAPLYKYRNNDMLLWEVFCAGCYEILFVGDIDLLTLPSYEIFAFNSIPIKEL